ncbi:beta galactosidase jelly roll domain-containing protein [Actinophytocola sp. NPDC049390]|uniref:beta galactosidase jelly roll domain-containing protein n=1 Tax=Actinophytocola sp. NPDC049390 TaxID=3363894 RepID=UPI00378CD39A
MPRDQDVPVALRFDGTGAYRVLMFVNGWQMGQFTADLGPQREFVLPSGVLRPDGKNTLALAVIALEDSTLGQVSLVPLANHRVR